jgi:hypothetical protein
MRLSMPGLSRVKTTGAGGGGPQKGQRPAGGGGGRAGSNAIRRMVRHLVQEEAEEVQRQGRQGGLVPRQPRQQLATVSNAGQALVKHWSSTGQSTGRNSPSRDPMLVKRCSAAAGTAHPPANGAERARNVSNTGQALVKHRSITGQILAKGLKCSAALGRGGGRGDSD